LLAAAAAAAPDCVVPVRVVPVSVVSAAEVVRPDVGAEDDANGDDADDGRNDDGRNDDDDSDEDRGRTGPFPPPLPLSLPPGGASFGSTALPHSGAAANYRPFNPGPGNGSGLNQTNLNRG
jgi:hypothetical protein